MKDLEEQRGCVKFCFKLRKTATETWKMLQQAFGDECMSRTHCFEWYSHFKTGRNSMDEDRRSGRPSTSTDDVHIDAVHDLFLQNHCLTIREIAKDVGISFGSCQAILTEKLNMRCVAAKFVQRTISLVVPCAQFSGEKRNDRCTPATLLSRFGSRGLFSVS